MLKIYQYFLFRIYYFYLNTFKEKDMPIFYVGGVSSLIIGLTVMLIYHYFQYKDYLPAVGAYELIFAGGIIWVINYFFFVRDREFLKKGFKNNVLGGIMIVVYILLLITLLIVQANMNRAKLGL